MEISETSKSCPPDFSIIFQKPSLEFLVQAIKNSTEENEANKIMTQLAEVMHEAEGETFEQSLSGVTHLLQKGYSSIFMTYADLIRKMMSHFTKISRLLEASYSNHDDNVESRMLKILSIIAELIRQNPKYYFPFTRKFMITVFQIDYELLQKSSQRRDILAILSVVFQNFSRQGRLINRYSMMSMLKISLLEKYSLIEELFTLQMFNRSICNLAKKGLLFSTQEFKKYRVLETISQFIEINEIELFVAKLKLAKMYFGKKDRENVQQSI